MEVRFLSPAPRASSTLEAGKAAKTDMKYVIGNWKMNTTVPEAVALAGRVEDGVEDLFTSGKELPTVVVCPPLTALAPVGDVLKGRAVAVGAQNCHQDEPGAQTGEVAASMLAGLAEYVLVGHSERRVAGETESQVAAKLQAVVKAGLTPVLCVGDTEAEAAPGEEAVRQLQSAIAEVKAADVETLLVAYEPRWAIGGDHLADVDHAASAVATLRAALEVAGLGDKSAVLYGGSVTPDDVTYATAIEGVSGVLVGHESLEATHFVSIVGQVAG